MYNSGVTVMLAHILWKATGKHADAYAVEHLFGPLGIESFYWKKTPTGLIDTEGGGARQDCEMRIYHPATRR